MARRRRISGAWFLACALAPTVEGADGATSGDAGLQRTVDAVATFDLLANLDGGLDTGVEVPGTVDLIGELGSIGAAGSCAHRFRIFLQGTAGGDFSAERVGDTQIVSSIEAPNTVKLFEAWYRYTLPGARGSVLVGLHDLNTEFYVLERASLLMHSSFGNGPEIAQANASIFPTTAPAALVRFDARNPFYVSAGVYDGIPGKASDPYGTHIRFDDGDGVFGIVEAGAGDGGSMPWKAALGAWHSTATFDDVSGQTRSNNSGVYLIGEAPLPLDAVPGEPGMFFHFGIARAGRNMIDKYVGGGFLWTAPFSARTEDAFSLGVARAWLTDAHRRATGIRTRSETTVELTYRWTVNQWLTLQPDLQVVIDPGATAGAKDALIAGLRIILTAKHRAPP